MNNIVQDLRDLADYLEQHPDLPRPLSGAQFDVFVEDKEELGRLSRILGSARKGSAERWFWVSKTFGCLRFEVNCLREAICQRKVVGTRTIPMQIIPEHEEEIVEWDCPESILEEDRSSDAG